MIQVINNLARNSTSTIELMFCYLWFKDDKIRQFLLTELKDAAARGVKVKILLDGETGASAAVKALLKIDEALADVQSRETETRNRAKSSVTSDVKTRHRSSTSVPLNVPLNQTSWQARKLL